MESATGSHKDAQAPDWRSRLGDMTGFTEPGSACVNVVMCRCARVQQRGRAAALPGSASPFSSSVAFGGSPCFNPSSTPSAALGGPLRSKKTNRARRVGAPGRKGKRSLFE